MRRPPCARWSGAAERVPEASEVQNHLGLAYLGRRGAPAKRSLAFERAWRSTATTAAALTTSICRAEPIRALRERCRAARAICRPRVRRLPSLRCRTRSSTARSPATSKITSLKHTKQREAILEIFLEMYRAHHRRRPVPARCASCTRRSATRPSTAPMKLLCEAGLAHEHNFDGTTRYEIAHQHHDHLVCMRCGKIIEFECEMIEKAQEQIAERYQLPRAAPPPRALRPLRQVPERRPAPTTDLSRQSLGPLTARRPRRA